MEEIERSIVVNRSRASVFEQWTRFEQYPHFMPGVEEVQQTDRTRLHWRGRVQGRVIEWDAAITTLDTDVEIGWTNVSGPRAAVLVRLQSTDESHTSLQFHLSYVPYATSIPD